MYNEDLKKRFVRDYTGSLNTANVAATVFNAVEKYETEWNADLCTEAQRNFSRLLMRCWTAFQKQVDDAHDSQGVRQVVHRHESSRRL